MVTLSLGPWCRYVREVRTRGVLGDVALLSDQSSVYRLATFGVDVCMIEIGEQFSVMFRTMSITRQLANSPTPQVPSSAQLSHPPLM
jgi:hypothetical protein